MKLIVKLLIVSMMLFLTLHYCQQSMAQQPSIDNGGQTGADNTIETQQLYNLNNIISLFEKVTAGINSTNFSMSKSYLSNMKNTYQNYNTNLAGLDDNSPYAGIDKNLEDLIKATEAYISESEDIYYNYKIVQIFNVRKDYSKTNEYGTHILITANDLLSQHTNLKNNISIIEKNADNIGISTDPLDQGLQNIIYYESMLVNYFVNGTSGMGQGYGIYNGYDIEGYQEIYDYLSSKNQQIPAALANYIIPKTRISTGLTLNVSNRSAHFGDIIAISGVLSYNNGTAIADNKIVLSFNNQTFESLTNDSGMYHFELCLNGSINMDSYELVTSFPGKITPDVFIESSRSNRVTLMLELQNVYISILSPQQSLIIGDNLVVSGGLIAENGIPVAGANVSTFFRKKDQVAPDAIVNSGLTDSYGLYQINNAIPIDTTPGEYYFYTAYTWPSTRLVHAVNSSLLEISITPTRPIFVIDSLPLIYFNDDLLGIQGRLVTVNNQNISGQAIYASLAGNNFDGDVTNDNGVFKLSHIVTSGEPPGIKGLTLTTSGNGGSVLANSVAVVTIIVLPYDKTIFLLTAAVIVLSVIAAAIIIALFIRRKRNMTSPEKTRLE